MDESTRSIIASPRVHDLLRKLHQQSEAQEKSFGQIFFYISRLARFYLFNETWTAASDDHMRDKFVSLEVEK